jgi:Zn-dependent protease with chaperone function
MFGNFIYFILVLLIYLTYQPTDETYFTALDSFTFFFGLTFIFAFFTRLQFQRIERRISKGEFLRIDHQFSSTLLRQSIMAVVLFAIDIYVLNLSSFLADMAPFKTIPTLLALLFLAVFVFYLALVWIFAYGSYQELYRAEISRQSYVFSNISFSIPVLLPWLFLSGIADIIRALPFEGPKNFMATTEGEVSYFIFFLLVVAILGPFVIQKFWRCKPLENGYYRSRIESLCRRAELAYADILYWPIFGGKMVTAGVMGLVKKFRYILVTNSLLQLLEPEEIDAVIAHEIGHIKKKHLLLYLGFFVGYMLVSYVAFDVIIFAIIYAEPVHWLIDKTGFSQTAVISSISSVVIISVFLIYFRFIFGFFMRNFERQADTYVYALFDSGKPLISTLEKIAATSGQSADKPNWHHFSIRQRIDFLRKCEADASWISRHDTKIKKSIGVYLGCLLLLGVLGYQLNVGTIGERLNSHFLEKVILRQIDKGSDNPNLYRLLGNIHYSKKNWSGVQDAWETALSLDPKNAEVLNNLAWHYATCEDEQYLDPDRALALATMAARLANLPHIWDTLAESYYVNGMHRQAVEAARNALGLAKKNRSYYSDQLKKFKEAGGN